MGRSKFPRRRLARLRPLSERGRRPGRMVLDKLDLEDFPQQLELFASDLSTFLYSLNEFPEFTDKAVDVPIIAFEDDLRVKPSPVFILLIALKTFLVLGVVLDSIRRWMTFILMKA